MTIAFDAYTANTRTGTGSTQSFNHTPLGVPRSATVIIQHGASDTEHVTGVTYGTVAMTRVDSALTSTGEPGRTTIYHLGSGVPSGPQLVVITLSTGTTDDIEANCVTHTAAADVEVVTWGKVQGETANPSTSLVASGRVNDVVGGIYSGHDLTASVTAGTGITGMDSKSFAGGTFVAKTGRRSTIDSFDFTFAYTQTIEDTAMLAVMLAEVPAVPTTPTTRTAPSASRPAPSSARPAPSGARPPKSTITPPPPPTTPPTPPPTTRPYPAWSTALMADMVPPALSTDVVLTPGTYTGAQFNTWLQGLVPGTSSQWRSAVAANCTINLTATNGASMLNGKSYIQLDLTDTTVNNLQSSAGSESGAFCFKGGSHHIRVVNGTIDGHNRYVGVANNTDIVDHQTGFIVKGQAYKIEWDGTQFLNIRGFGWDVTSLDSGASPSNGYGYGADIWVHDCLLTGAEQGWALISARRVLCQRNVMEDIAGTPIDFESEYTGNRIEDVLIEDLTVRRFGNQCVATGVPTNCKWFQASPNNTDQGTGASNLGSTGVQFNNIWIRDVTIEEGHVVASLGGLSIRADKSNPKNNWIIERVVSQDAATVNSSAMTSFNAFNGLQLLNNTQITANHGNLYNQGASDGGTVPNVNVTVSGNVT